MLTIMFTISVGSDGHSPFAGGTGVWGGRRARIACVRCIRYAGVVCTLCCVWYARIACMRCVMLALVRRALTYTHVLIIRMLALMVCG